MKGNEHCQKKHNITFRRHHAWLYSTYYSLQNHLQYMTCLSEFPLALVGHGANIYLFRRDSNPGPEENALRLVHPL